MYNYIDVGTTKNCMWHRIETKYMEKYREKFKNIDFCISVARYAESDPEKTQKLFMGIVIDLDAPDASGLEDVLREAITLREYFHNDIGLLKEDVHWYFSGNRGIHVVIDPEVLGIEADEFLHLTIKNVVKEIANKLSLKHVDYSLYARRHLCRAIGTRHSKSGLYKIELDPNDLNLLPDEIRVMAKSQREPLYREGPIKNDSAITNFKKLFDRAKAKASRQIDGLGAVALPDLKFLDGHPICIRDLMHKSIRRPGDRNRAEMALITYFKDTGNPKNSTLSILKPWTEKIPDNMTSTPLKERVSHLKSQVDYIYSSDQYHFACRYIRSLGTKSNPITCEKDCEINKLNPVRVADRIKANHVLMHTADAFYEYRYGLYIKLPDEQVDRWVKEIIDQRYTGRFADEVKRNVRVDCHVEEDKVNKLDMLNLKNGMFDPKTYQLLPWLPNYHSTIRLNVEYNENATCPLWQKSLKEIFEDNMDKVDMLQEIFGACLSHRTYDKIFFLCGDGSNGKSLVLYVLQKLLGEDNTSAVQMDQLKKDCYIASLFGKLANISLETRSKSRIVDDKVKMISSGDLIQADNKFGHPFWFNPFCKMIYAANDLPRTDDRSYAYYRRLVILTFNRRFVLGKDADPKLKDKIANAELPGILIWAVNGLKRLNERGYFKTTQDMNADIEEYLIENDTVYQFVNETCDLDFSATISVDGLYRNFKQWCEDSGYKAKGKIRFGKDIKRLCPNVTTGTDGHSRTWEGITSNYVTFGTYDEKKKTYGIYNR